ncbi:cellulose binding domain-containing protein [Streptomyces sp. SCL15-6]|uniref:cellulose binding domain-containing protein n=1 Tax=Streptomyces sp. SCL15-6 TaxID=2967222 RepID=UPI00296600A2|nr:cellulose binding domain-containing protein [Streptomyces sp. SCL15-6]
MSHTLNRTNHYSGVKYKDDPTIFAWDLMNEPRYGGQSDGENVEGTTLRAWVDEMGAYVKAIDPNHLLGAGIEGHGTQYGFGGDEGNPFVRLQQSPYLDFTSAHPYPTEYWADLTLDETKELVRAWITDSHEKVGKPFFMGEFNVDRAAWWSEIYADFEATGGDGSAFWWYQDPEIDGKFGVTQGDPELDVFRAHSLRMAAKSDRTSQTGSLSSSPSTGEPTTPPEPTTTPDPTGTPTASPTAGTPCRVDYRLSDWGTTFNADVTIHNTGSTAVDRWELSFTFPGGQSVTQIWNATRVQDGRRVTVTHPSGYNTSIAPGATVNFGFSGASQAGTNGVPDSFTLNGTACSSG